MERGDSGCESDSSLELLPPHSGSSLRLATGEKSTGARQGAAEAPAIIDEDPWLMAVK